MIKHHHKNNNHATAFDVVVYFVIPLVLILIALRIDSARFLFTTKGAQPTITATLGTGPINTQANTVVPVSLQLSASDNNKISGAELYIMFNADGSDTLAFESYADTTGTFTKEVIKEVRTFNSMKLLHIVLIADKKKDDLSSQALLTLRFKANKNGTDNVIFLTQASSVVGPIIGIQYTITPKNEAHTTIMVSDAAPTTQTTPTTAPATNTPAPTPQPTATPTPSSSSPMGISASPQPSASPRPTATPTVTPVPTQIGSVRLNLFLRFQGISQAPSAAYCQNKKIKVTVSGGALSQAKTYSDVTVSSNGQRIYSGTLALQGVPPGNTYKIAIKGPQHVQRTFCTLEPQDVTSYYRCPSNTGITLQAGDNEADFRNVLQYVGDFPLQDGVLNQQDVQFLRSRVLSSLENQAADVNCDGVVNGNDYSLLIESMKIKYDDEQ